MANFTPQEIEEMLQEFFDVVGKRQYIGARYVPIFGRKNEDTIEWDNLAPYEPLTVVMHNGVSYVSKQYVPAGIEITDTAYWAETYRFNAQVEQYRQEVLQFQSQIDQIREDMESDFVPFPDSSAYPKYGTSGQVLTTLTNGATKWEDPVTVDAAIAEPLIEAWLDEHPEATTTVLDGSITNQKIANGTIEDIKLVTKGGVVQNVGDFIHYQLAASRIMELTDIAVPSGARFYFKPLTWGGGATTGFTLSGIDDGYQTVLGRVNALGNGIVVTSDTSYDYLRVGVDAGTVPVSAVELSCIVVNLDDDALGAYVINNLLDIDAIPKNPFISRGYITTTTLTDKNEIGCYLLASQYTAQITDGPTGGLSGDYLMTVFKFANGYAQVLDSLADASEHHIRFVLTASGTGSWNSYKYVAPPTPFTSNGYITTNTLTDKNQFGCYLLVSQYAAQITDGPTGGLSGDYLLIVYPFGNGYSQELVALKNGAERHVRYVLNSSQTGTWYSFKPYIFPRKVAIFGDSIGAGQIGGITPTTYSQFGYAGACKLKNYDYTNYSIGGIGYSHTVDSHNAVYEINRRDISDVDIVLLAFGVNDWRNNRPLGTPNDTTVDTICGGLNAALAKVNEKNPTASIIVFSPLNNRSYSAETAEDKWALGYERGDAGTLQDVYNALKSVCDKKQVSFVDLSHNLPALNVMNINNTAVLGDGLHPTEHTYKLLSNIIANYI